MKITHIRSEQPIFENVHFELKQNGKNNFVIIPAKDIDMYSPFPPVLKNDPFRNETQYILAYQKKANLKTRQKKTIKNGEKYISKYCKKKKLEHELLIAYKKETVLKLNGEDYILLLLFGAYQKVKH